jgi:hypothetical protein
VTRHIQSDAGRRWHGGDEGQDEDEGQQGEKPSKPSWSQHGNHPFAGRPSTGNDGRPLILGGAVLEEIPLRSAVAL